MNTTQELKDIKNLLLEINQDDDVDTQFIDNEENVFEQADSVELSDMKKIESFVIDISADSFIYLAKKAHSKNIKLNDLIAEIINQYIENLPEDK